MIIICYNNDRGDIHWKELHSAWMLETDYCLLELS